LQFGSDCGCGDDCQRHWSYSPLLVTARNGAILAVEELNQHLGPEINLIVMDDESSKAKGRERLQSLIDQGVGIFIVSVTSGSYADMEETVNAHELLAISPTVSSNIFKGKDDNFFRMAADVSTYAQRLAQYAVEQRQGHTAAIYDTNNQAIWGTVDRQLPSDCGIPGEQYES
jgi:branched-chain amino acid transport system substrate-binding protein